MKQLNKAVGLIVAIIALSTFFFGYYAYDVHRKGATINQAITISYQRIHYLLTANTAISTLEAGLDNYLLTGNRQYTAGAPTQTAAIYTALTAAAQPVPEANETSALIHTIIRLVTQQQEIYHQQLQQPRSNIISPQLLQRQQLTDSIHTATNRLLLHTRQQLEQATRQQALYNRYALWTTWAGFITLFLLLCGLLLYVRRIMQFRDAGENTLRSSEARYRQLVEDMQVVMFIIDLGGYFIYANKRVSEMSGYSNKELIDNHASMLLDDATSEQLRVFFSDQHGQGIAQTTQEFQIRTKSGDLKWIEMYTTLDMKNGQIRGFQGIIKDIDENKKMRLEMARLEMIQKETQYRLNAIMDHSPSIIFIKDTNGKYLMINKQFELSTGLSSDMVIGKKDSDLIPGHIADTYAQSDLQVIQGRQSINVVEILPVAGHQRHHLLTKFPLLNNEQQLFGIGGIGMDITDRVIYEKELEGAKQIAEDAKKVQEIFLANMSHEIRTPINGITGMTYLLDKSLLSAEQREYVDTIKDCSQHLLVLIDDILDFSRIRSGKLNLEATCIDLRKIMLHAAYLSQQVAARKGIGFGCDIDPAIPENLIGDPVRIAQVISNLLDNAVKFTSQGSVLLRARLLQETNTTATVFLEVKDTGIGIPPDKLHVIFESFTQSSTATTRKYGGTGLGLAICKELITLHGGKIGVSSVLTEGATFYVEIPFVLPAGQVAPTHLKISDAENSLQGTYLLLAEDNSINQKVAQRILEQAGAAVDIVANGKSVLKQVLEKKYDCILMDIQMPEMDGYQAARLLREMGVKTPIIAITASAIAGEKEKCLRAGMNDYLTKPFTPKDLFHKILFSTGAATPGDSSLPIATGQLPENVLVHFSHIRSLLNNETTFIIETLSAFTEQTPGNCAALQQAATTEQWEEVKFLAHKMKSGVNLVGIPVAASLLATLEKDAMEKQNMHTVQTRIQQLSLLLQQATGEIKAEITRMEQSLSGML
ncbi:PAS domain S-box protein [Chitinophaga nivalis]|uniref:histidine kinase n=1 Tax=Chitinophaga nivalis TaxID=2991709 RepID=A0ABT3IPL7_9BACT|nr:PAS domain S-box protein [Chitinophaga nivalis]MCW3464398.1 PAS domain S-box protein [Chitinophaga nivalis]MCW3485911.1 PAS domain S-box protein [Chitinophaga nivalis]